MGWPLGPEYTVHRLHLYPLPYTNRAATDRDSWQATTHGTYRTQCTVRTADIARHHYRTGRLCLVSPTRT